MNDIVYIDGGVVIETPFFKYKDAGALYGIPSECMDIIIPTDYINGDRCLIITEVDVNGKKVVNAPSFFKAYYARTFFSTKCKFAVFFSNTISDCFGEFYNKKDDVLALLKENDVCSATSQILYRLSIVSLVAAFDTLISDLILFIATKNRDSFLKAIDIAVPSNKKSKIMDRILHMWCDNTVDSAEQEVIDHVLRSSYTNLKDVRSYIKELYQVVIPNDKQIKKILYWRDLIAHRNGRQKNGSVIEFKKNEVYDIIETVSKFVKNIKDIIYTKYSTESQTN